MKKNYLKITLDLLMALTFTLLMNPRVLNGLPFHEIAGLILGVAILTHISLNMKWVINTSKKIFDPKLPKKTRFSYLLNILLLVSMSTIIVTGILISRVVFPSLGSGENHSIKGLHNLAANTTLVLVGLHIGVHWQWVMSIFKKIVKTKEGKLRKGIILTIIIALAIIIGAIQWFASHSTATSFKPDAEKMKEIANKFQGAPKGDFHGKEGHGGTSNPFLIIVQYFGIFAAITIPVYYLETKILRKRRQQKK